MVNHRHCKGNAFADALGFCVIIFLVYMFLIIPYQPINSEKNAVLQKMVTTLKGSHIESSFKAQLSDFMSDDKLSNKEFKELEELYNSYQTSVISGSQAKFAESKSSQSKVVADEGDSKQFQWFIFVAVFLLIGFIGFQRVISG